MANALRLSRAQIARFVGNDPEAIKQLEKLFGLVETNINNGQIDAVQIEAGTAQATANEIAARVSSVEQTLAEIALQPREEIVFPAQTGGAGVTLTTVEVDVGSNAKTGGKFTIAGAGFTPGKPVLIQQAVGPYTGKGTRADEAEMDQLSVSAAVTDSATITAYWASPRRVKGNFKFNYQVSA
jgi:hypothetical protein